MNDDEFFDLIQRLLKVEDDSWGMYAFSRDILQNKVDEQMKKAMIKKAICCGYEKAEEVISVYGNNPFDIARRLGLNVRISYEAQASDRVLFALFTPPKDILLMEEPIKKAAFIPEIHNTITEEQIMALLLGHELFHYFEENDKCIYTRTEKISLFHFWKFKYRSTIRALSEIAAMYFTKRLNRFSWSPFALDFILYYNYDREVAMRIYEEVFHCTYNTNGGSYEQ